MLGAFEPVEIGFAAPERSATDDGATVGPTPHRRHRSQRNQRQSRAQHDRQSHYAAEPPGGFAVEPAEAAHDVERGEVGGTPG